MTQSIDQIETSVREALTPIPEHMKAKHDSSPNSWTREIKDRLCKLGQSSGFKVGAFGCGTATPNWGEWLYDMTWVEMQGDRFVSLPLALESEWTLRGIEDDFHKLVQCRAGLRVMIFEQKDRVIIAKLHELKARIGDFQGTVLGDRYLFAANSWDKTGFIFESYSAR